MEDLGRFNYIRNSVKATVDAYDGDVHLYIFDTQDPLITAYQHLFPELFSPASAMPAGLREHTRAPEMLFRAQAEIYRTYHARSGVVLQSRRSVGSGPPSRLARGGEPQPVPPRPT